MYQEFDNNETKDISGNQSADPAAESVSAVSNETPQTDTSSTQNTDTTDVAVSAEASVFPEENADNGMTSSGESAEEAISTDSDIPQQTDTTPVESADGTAPEDQTESAETEPSVSVEPADESVTADTVSEQEEHPQEEQPQEEQPQEEQPQEEQPQEEQPQEEQPQEEQPQEEQPQGSTNGNGNYLFYGGEAVPTGINYGDTLKFLTEQLRYDGGELKQARQKKDGSGIVVSEEKTGEFCSYCGLPITGVDYYRLPDGRKRCTNCNRSLVKSLEELNSIFNTVLLNMELFFGAVIDVPVYVEMLEERKLKKKVSKGLGNPPKNALILGVAVKSKDNYTIYVENGIPRISLIETIAHELTHIWQYTHWNVKNIKKRYGSKMRLVVYEGMATWTEIQYLYLIGENNVAKREERITSMRPDEYGIGFNLYEERYPLSYETMSCDATPFLSGEAPLD